MELRKICKSYHGCPVLTDVSIRIESGVTALWAPSGAGKTTLLRILLGLEQPDSGELIGADVRWAAVFQENRLLEGLDAEGNLRFALGADFSPATADAMLNRLGLSDAAGKPVRDWSGGMKRRLALARALLAPSDAIALDEPFTGLDGANRRAAAACIAQSAETKPVLLVTHEGTDLDTLKARVIQL